jgi:hypothetical protein
MGPRKAYKDMLDNKVSPITCVSMNHQNQLEKMANGAMFATSAANDRPCRTFSDVRCEGSDGQLEEASIGSRSVIWPRAAPFQARSAQPVHSTPSTLPHSS